MHTEKDQFPSVRALWTPYGAALPADIPQGLRLAVPQHEPGGRTLSVRDEEAGHRH